MLRYACAVPVLLLSVQASLADGPSPGNWQGVWAGTCRIDGKDVFLRLRLEHTSGGIGGSAYSRRLGVRQAPVGELTFTSGRLALSFATPEGSVQLSCETQGDELRGTAQFHQSSGGCWLRRRRAVDAASFDKLRGNYEVAPGHVLFVGRYDPASYFFLADGDWRAELVPVGADEFLCEDLRTIRFETDRSGSSIAARVSSAGGQTRRAARVRLYEQEPVTFSAGDVRLAGTLTLPTGAGPHPAVVFVHGSGPSQRSSYAVEADRFARSGIATLAFDKRGTGESTGDWHTAGFEELADDVLAGVRFLRRDRRIRPHRVGLFGISQAGWIIPLAAARTSEVAFIVPVSGGAVTPAEQELWRHRQNLEYLRVPERFIELERKAAAMAYDWQRRVQLGSMPIPNPFADDNLNMHHDAAAVLRQVQQPVLAIFGGMDTLTPPHESAALWADALRRRGNDDYSVRLFPRGDHGLFEGGTTGSPLETRRELRWVPGYFDTVVRWIQHHTGGPEFPAARQVDVTGDGIPVESRGMHRVSWYGSGAVQPWQLLVSLIAFAGPSWPCPPRGCGVSCDAGRHNNYRPGSAPPPTRQRRWAFSAPAP
jgi:dienelactone hydrolase